jgi:hypothetical protein
METSEPVQACDGIALVLRFVGPGLILHRDWFFFLFRCCSRHNRVQKRWAQVCVQVCAQVCAHFELEE